MRIKVAAFLILALFSGSASYAKPYSRAMIFNGFGFQTAIFSGMLQAARDSGYPPDVIVGLCGGALAAMVANKFPDGKSQLDFLTSEKFYSFLTKNITVRNDGKLVRFVSIYLYNKYINNTFGIIPDYFEEYLLDVPRHFDFGFDASFTQGYIPVILQSSRMLFNPAAVEAERINERLKIFPGKRRKSDEKIFQMTYFTDETTKAVLDSIETIKKLSIAEIYENSAIDKNVTIMSDAGILDATRASISDPFLMVPQEIKGEYYLTGAIDRLPVEFVNAISDESFALYTRGYDEILRSMFKSFGFDPYSRLEYLDKKNMYPDYMVDLSDLPNRLVLDPNINLKTWRVESKIKDYASYKAIVQEQYNYGYTRTLEALAFRNSLAHIRQSYIIKLCQGSGTPDEGNARKMPSEISGE